MHRRLSLAKYSEQGSSGLCGKTFINFWKETNTVVLGVSWLIIL